MVTMGIEERMIKASALAGFSDILFGVILSLWGFDDWWFEHLHTFGVLGVGMVFYAFYHWLLK